MDLPFKVFNTRASAEGGQRFFELPFLDESRSSEDAHDSSPSTLFINSFATSLLASSVCFNSQIS
jgi:hypothetical protein